MNGSASSEPMMGFADRKRVAVMLVWLVGFALILPGWASAQDLSVAETERLVRADYYEGFPVEEARRISADGAARLIEMLATPGERHAHANVLVALGASGQAGALEAIEGWAAIPREGEIDRDTFRAWQSLPYALGHLAEHDRRAISRLESELSGETPNFTFRHQRGARLNRLARRSAATALGMTGLPEAADVLDRAERRSTDVEFENHLRESRVLLDRRAVQRRSR